MASSYETALYSVAKFFVPDWEDVVDSGIGLSYRPASARLHRLVVVGRYRYDKSTTLCQDRLYPPVRD